MLTAMGKQFHPTCFTCSNCLESLDGEQFMVEEDTVFCKECYSRLRAPRCYRCEEAIMSSLGKRATLITCDGNKYHYQCYSCKECGDSLNGKQVFLRKSEIV